MSHVGGNAPDGVAYAGWTPEPPPKKRRSALKVFVVGAVVVAIAGGAWAFVEYRARAEREAARQEQLAQQAKQRAEQQAVYDNCRSAIGPLLDALTAVDARLDVGLSEVELASLVGNASVAYNGVDLVALQENTDCLSAGAKLEDALNSYNQSVTQWRDCIFDYYCDVDYIDSDLQSKWSDAALNIDAANELLQGLDPGVAGDAEITKKS